jgi:outer membrane protein TolC
MVEKASTRLRKIGNSAGLAVAAVACCSLVYGQTTNLNSAPSSFNSSTSLFSSSSSSLFSAGGTGSSSSLGLQGGTNVGTTQNPFLGSVPQKPLPGNYTLRLRDAIDRGLKFNLGLLLSGEGERQARGARLNTLSELLPNVTTRTTETVEQVNLAAFGLPSIPGVRPIVGPFGVFDARGFVTQRVVDLPAIFNLRARSENVNAARYTYQDARELVVLVVGGTYLQAIAGAARIEAIRAQLATAGALFRQANDMRKAGVSAGIDVLRTQVEMQSQQQRLLAAQNEFEKQKLALARTIGFSPGQQFELADKIPFSASPQITLEDALARAYGARSDIRSAEALLHAAENVKRSASGEALPSLKVNADYGVLGNNPGNSHGTFTTAAALEIPIFQGGKVRADVLQADALLQQRRAQLSDLRGRVDMEVRSAFLDLNSAAEQVAVAHSTVGLAQEQLTQARDRFAAGVADTIEVVQAQEAVATANENYIASVFGHNVAKLSLARAVGVAEKGSKEYLGDR